MMIICSWLGSKKYEQNADEYDLKRINEWIKNEKEQV